MDANTGGAAFPQIETREAWAGSHDSGYQVYGDVTGSGGMTLRDYFAAKAMQGYLASYAGINAVLPAASALAADAYAMADSMLAARGNR